MPRLKNYIKYLEKIHTYAESAGIKIVEQQVDCDGVFDHTTNKLYIDSDLSESVEIATLLHELGHALDYHLVNKKMSPKIWKAYGHVYEDRPVPKEHLDTVMAAEVRAWEIGRLLGKKLRIPLGKWFDKDEKAALANYRSTGE